MYYSSIFSIFLIVCFIVGIKAGNLLPIVVQMIFVAISFIVKSHTKNLDQFDLLKMASILFYSFLIGMVVGDVAYLIF